MSRQKKTDKKEDPPKKYTGRAAGILLHISSLPSPFGIGDLGKEAYAFADFLHETHQTYWQLLPLNPIESGKGNSPYSSTSSVAGNTLFISPQLLVEEQLLAPDEVRDVQIKSSDKVDYTGSEKIKSSLFKKAFHNFLHTDNKERKDDFDKYCSDEGSWLNDFALYTAIKNHHKGKPWYEWQQPFKLRDTKTLKDFESTAALEIQQIKWLQFVFAKQWHQLKAYCNGKKIKMFGDLPFYVSYDSADVWANRDIFSIDEEGEMIGVAGVPPDYFNANGQLWGMPVFKWNKLKELKYGWWINRVKKNFELFDIVRLDHFRAFADYWEVPADEETAINGEWKQGPGEDFFNALQNELGQLSFVAEDLGDINEAVYSLRDHFSFPGMKILQFAFSDNIAESDYIPHNYTSNFIVYTGTHDNNTTKGWFRKDISKGDRKRLKQYLGRSVGEKNINDVLIRMAYASIAKTAVIPMQDLLDLDEKARINMPASVGKNWLWRMKRATLTDDIKKYLADLTLLYNRV